MLREHRIRTTSAVAAAAAVLMLAGCSGTTGATPTPTPEPTWTCTPDTSGEPCTAEKAAAQAEQAEAYAEAEHTYREFTKEWSRLSMQGGTASPTPVMTSLATGQYLETISMFLASGYEGGLRTTAPLLVDQVLPVAYREGEVQLLVCEDGRDIRVLSSDGAVVGQGSYSASDVKVIRDGSGWKLSERFDTETSLCS